MHTLRNRGQMSGSELPRMEATAPHAPLCFCRCRFYSCHALSRSTAVSDERWRAKARGSQREEVARNVQQDKPSNIAQDNQTTTMHFSCSCTNRTVAGHPSADIFCFTDIHVVAELLQDSVSCMEQDYMHANEMQRLQAGHACMFKVFEGEPVLPHRCVYARHTPSYCCVDQGDKSHYVAASKCTA